MPSGPCANHKDIRDQDNAVLLFASESMFCWMGAHDSATSDFPTVCSGSSAQTFLWSVVQLQLLVARWCELLEGAFCLAAACEHGEEEGPQAFRRQGLHSACVRNFVRVPLLGGLWDLVTTYSWAHKLTCNWSITYIRPVRETIRRAIRPVKSSY